MEIEHFITLHFIIFSLALVFGLSNIFYLIYVRKNTKTRRYFIISTIISFVVMLLVVLVPYFLTYHGMKCSPADYMSRIQGCPSAIYYRLPFIYAFYPIMLIASGVLNAIGLVTAKKSHYKIWPYFVMLVLPVIYFLATVLYMSVIQEA